MIISKSKKLPEFLEYFLFDLLGNEQGFSAKKMFGAYGIFRYDKMFGIYEDEQMYFKVGSHNLQDYLEKGSIKFTYKKLGKDAYLSYYTLPEELYDDREELLKWINSSLNA